MDDLDLTKEKNLRGESFCKKRLEGDGRLANVDLDREDECGICLEPCTKWFCLIAVMQCASNAIAIGNYHPNVISLMLLMLTRNTLVIIIKSYGVLSKL